MKAPKISPDKNLELRLETIDPILRSIYLGAIHTFNDYENPDRLAQSAHSLRESITKLVRIKLGEDYNTKENDYEEDLNKQVFLKKIQKSIDPYPYPSRKYGIYKRVFEIYNDFVKLSHHGDTIDDEQFLQKFKEYERLMNELLDDYSVCLRHVEQALKIINPTKQDHFQLKIKLRFHSLVDYFFNYVSKDWLKILFEDNYFESPPKVEEGVFPPVWIESKYLKRISMLKDTDFEILCQIIEKCKLHGNVNERDFRIVEDFLSIALNVPMNFTDKIVKIIISRKWLYFPRRFNSSIPSQVISLIDKYFKNSFLPSGLITYFLELKEIKEKWDDNNQGSLIEEYDHFIAHPLKNVGYHDFMQFVELFDIQFLIKFRSTNYLASIFLQILIQLVGKYDIIEKYKKNLETNNPVLTFFGNPIRSIPLLNMNKLKVVGGITSEKDIDVLLFDLTIDMLEECITRKDEKILKMLKITIFDLSRNCIVFQKLLLSVFPNYPEYFEKEIDELLFSLVNIEDSYYEYYHFTSRIISSRKPAVRSRYIEKVISLRNEISTIENNPGGIRKVILLYEPIKDFLPIRQRKEFDEYSKNYPGLLTNGYLSTLYVNEIVMDNKPNSVLPLEDLIGILASRETKYKIDSDLEASIQTHIVDLTEILEDVQPEYAGIIIGELNKILGKKNIPTKKVIDFLNKVIKVSNPDERLVFEIALFLNHYLNDNLKPDELIKSISPIVNFLLKFLKPSSIYRVEKLDQSLLQHVLNTPSFHIWSLVIRFSALQHKNFITPILINEIKEQDMETMLFNGSSYMDPVFAYYFNHLLYINKDLSIQIFYKMPIQLKNDNKEAYYVLWSFLLMNNTVVVSNYDITYNKLLSHCGNIKTLKLENHDPHYRNLCRAILNPYLYELKDSSKLFQNYVKALPDHKRCQIIDILSDVLKEKKDGRNYSFNINILKKIINNPDFRNCNGFWEWFICSPFDENYSLGFIDSLTKSFEPSKVEPRLLDETITNLKNYMNFNEKMVLESLFNLLKKFLLYLDIDKLFDNLKSIRDIISIHNQKSYNIIIEYILRMGYHRFEELKIV